MNILKILKLAHTYYMVIKLAALDDEINKLNLPGEITQLIKSLDQRIRGRVFNEVKKDPKNITVDKINVIVEKIVSSIAEKGKKKLTGIDSDALSLYELISDPKIKHWFLNTVIKRDNYIKILKDEKDFDYSLIKNQLEKVEKFYRLLSDDQKTKMHIDDFSFEHMLDVIHYWPEKKTEEEVKPPEEIKLQEEVEGWEGKNVKVVPGTIVYGPKWEDERFNGWTIQELKTKEQQIFESAVLKHCLGAEYLDHYHEKIINGESRIFSLRDPSGAPKVTMETSPDLWEFIQTYAKRDSTPTPEQKAAIDEWKNHVHKNEDLEPQLETRSKLIASFVERGRNDAIIDKLLAAAFKGERPEVGYIEPPYTVLQRLASNIHLNQEDYQRIYDFAAKTDIIVDVGLANNPSISDKLYKKIVSEPYHKDSTLSYAFKNFKIKILNYEEITKMLSLQSRKSMLNHIFNNPSTSSAVVRKILKDNPDIVYDADAISDMRPILKFVDDYLAVRGYENWKIFRNMIDTLPEDILINICKHEGINTAHLPKEALLNKIYQLLIIDNETSDSYKRGLIERIHSPSKKTQIAMIGLDPGSIKNIDRPSEEMQRAAVSKEPSLIAYLIEKFGDVSEEIKIQAMTSDGDYIENINNPSEAVQMAAVESSANALGYIWDSKEGQISNEVLVAAITYSYRSLSAFKTHNVDVPEPLQDLAMEKSTRAIQFIQNPTEKTQLNAVENGGTKIGNIITGDYNHNYAGEKANFIPSEKVQLAAVKNDGSELYILYNMYKTLANDKEKNPTGQTEPSEAVKLESIINDGANIRMIDNPSEQLQLLAVTNSEDALPYILEKSIKLSEEVQLAAIKNSIGNCRRLLTSDTAHPGILSDHTKAVAISIYGAKALAYIDEPSEEMLQEATQLSDRDMIFSILKALKSPPESVLLTAVKKDGLILNAIYWMHGDAPESVQMEAVKQNGFALENIPEPSIEVQKAAITQNPKAIMYIEYPSDEMVAYADAVRVEREGE